MKKILLSLLTLLFVSVVNAQTGFPFDNEIRAFRHGDSISFPPKDGILFIGSSSIRKWTDLNERFPGKPIIRRGVGGCELWQIVDYYTPYILFPYHPRKIFIYAGENDIAAGKSGQFVFEEFEKLYKMIREQLPDATVYFMSVKMSPSREKYFSQVAIANKLIQDFLAGKPLSGFIDVNTPILKPATSMPDSALFLGDYLHLNSKGYDKWQQVLQAYVQ
jgi:hypothetical protein